MKTLNNEQNEDVREAFLSTLSPFDRFQREVADLLIDVLEITNGDAQGICEAQDDILSDCFRKEVSVRETAELIVLVMILTA